MYQKLLEKLIVENLELTEAQKNIVHYNIVTSKDKKEVRSIISERIDEQIDIVMKNYKKCIRQALLSEEVTTNIYQQVIYVANNFYLRITDDPIDEDGNVRGNFNPLDSFALSSFLDSEVLLALNVALSKYLAVMGETFYELCGLFASFNNWHEEDMEALEKQTDLTNLKSDI